jgi:ankyrin repeat protein
MRTLIDSNADVNKTTNEGATPLYIAANKGDGLVVLELIGAGADINKATYDGLTPLYAATRRDHAPIVELLRDFGAL